MTDIGTRGSNGIDSGRSVGRRSLLRWGLAATSALAAAPLASACGNDSETVGADGKVKLRVVGFEVSPEEKGTPLDKAYKKFLADFRADNPDIEIESLPTDPEFATKIIVDLASGTAPDIWSQDASSLAPLIDRNLLLDMRKCVEQVPALDLDRFFPQVLEIHEQPDGAIYGLPNDFTPMVTYFNAELMKQNGLSAPAPGWTWDTHLDLARQLTRDAKGRSPEDAGFDPATVEQWGYSAGKYAYQWVYKIWQNGGDVLSPERDTASGYLDSPETLEALQWHADLVLKHRVAPKPSVLDAMTQKSSFESSFLSGRFAMYDSGHWSLVGLSAAEEFRPEIVGVAPQPKRETDATVLYESSFVIRYDLPEEAIQAAAKFVEAATGREYQDTKAITGIAIAANEESARAASENPDAKFGELDATFVDAASKGRPPSGSKVAKYPTVETMLDELMDRILHSGAVEEEVAKTVESIDKELSSK